MLCETKTCQIKRVYEPKSLYSKYAGELRPSANICEPFLQAPDVLSMAMSPELEYFNPTSTTYLANKRFFTEFLDHDVSPCFRPRLTVLFRSSHRFPPKKCNEIKCYLCSWYEGGVCVSRTNNQDASRGEEKADHQHTRIERS